MKGSPSGGSRSIGVCGTIIDGTDRYAGIITAGHGLSLFGENQALYMNSSEFGEVTKLEYQETCRTHIYITILNL